jgi:hypothetical protein
VFDWFFHPSRRVDFYRPLLNVFSLFGLSQLVFAIFFLVVGLPDPPVSTVSMGALAIVGAIVIRAFGPDPYKEPEPQAHPKDDNSSFCSDCGKQYELRQSQRGFDSRTGLPKLSFRLGCPDADPTEETEEWKSYRRSWSGPSSVYSATPPFRGQRYQWPNCGKVVRSALLPPTHQHEASATSTSCPACIQQMLSDDIIDLASARRLLGNVGQTQ